MRTSSLWRIILVVALLAMLLEQPAAIWDKRLLPRRRIRQGRNWKRNRERWVRRLRRRQRRYPTLPSAPRRGRHRRGLPQRLATECPVALSVQEQPRRVRALQSWGRQPKRPPQPTPAAAPPAVAVADPLAALRARRGWIDQVDEPQLWATLRQVRWPTGPVCPRCGEREARYLQLLDPDYRGGLGRWRCQVCAEAGDPGSGGTFTPLTGTLLDGMRIDVRTLWLSLELFAAGKAGVTAAQEADVNRHTTDRLFRLLRAAIYQTRAETPIALAVEDVAEFDEVYITAGLKGGAGGVGTGTRAAPAGTQTAGTRHLGE
ncbi:MAG TPA: transposase [Anaerolineae bacterium]|nr:transposase [Anaerolineae bacterium]